MAGPYCETCEFWYQNVRGDYGECRDPAKLYYSHSGLVNSRPETHLEMTCQNHTSAKMKPLWKAITHNGMRWVVRANDEAGARLEIQEAGGREVVSLAPFYESKTASAQSNDQPRRETALWRR